jgi:hypothetical protein
MKAYLLYFVITLVVCGGIFHAAITDPSYQARKDCSIAEISPDFTPEERNKCRELLRHKL